MYPLIQFEFTAAGGVAVPGVLGQFATERLDPVNPPIRVCTSQKPEGVPEAARLNSIRVAPACGP